MSSFRTSVSLFSLWTHITWIYIFPMDRVNCSNTCGMQGSMVCFFFLFSWSGRGAQRMTCGCSALSPESKVILWYLWLSISGCLGWMNKNNLEFWFAQISQCNTIFLTYPKPNSQFPLKVCHVNPWWNWLMGWNTYEVIRSLKSLMDILTLIMS